MANMTRSSIGLSEELSDYIQDHSSQPSDVQRQLQEATASLGPVSGMQIGADQGTLLTLLVSAMQPSFVVEVGTFTGYSSLAMARGLPTGATLLCCDVSETWTSLAKEHWEAAGVSQSIKLKIGPALATLQELPAFPTIDFAFVDADKTGYLDYYEEILPRLSKSGLLAIDNTLWGGRVLHEADENTDTAAIQAFNRHIADDDRCEQVLLPIGDGLTLLRRR